MTCIADFFAWVMAECHAVVPNYWWDIVIFTALTKVLQFPINIWCHLNTMKMVSIMPDTNRLKIKFFGDNDRIGEESAKLFKEKHYHPLLSLLPLAIQIVILMGFVDVIYRIAAQEKGSLLSMVPARDGGISWIMPLCAGAAAWFLGWCQNRINALQHEQTRTQQMVTNGISICISLFLGSFVGMGVGLYWVFSNLFSIVAQLATNALMPPKKFVDYAALYKTRDELAKLEALGRVEVSKEDKRREKRDYRNFFKVANKHIVFYSEASGFYKYYKNIIGWLLEHSNLTIHYVTSDPKDQIFKIASGQPRIRPYYIGQMKLITLFMKMDADMLLTSTPDLNTFQLKRSYVRRDAFYVYVPHGVASTHLTTREKAHAHFDAVLCCGQHQIREFRASEKLYGTAAKELPICGYGLLDDLVAGYEARKGAKHDKPLVLIAPSHQADNIMDSCLDDLISSLYGHGYRIVVRPHPQYKKRYPARLDAIVERYRDRIGEDLSFELDFATNTSIMDADVLVCDWSGIAFEYAFTTLKPVLSVNTPMKVINPNYKLIDLPVLDITLRDDIGRSVELSDVGKAAGLVESMLKDQLLWQDRIKAIRERTVNNLGHFGEAAGQYILNTLIARRKGTKK